MSLIPKKIYQSWKTKKLPENIQDIVKKTISMNPDYEYELWDDKDCRNFLLENFGINYANAFDILIPGAFKCDFWRYAILYVNGGVYMDIDMIPEEPFRNILKPDDRFVSIVDRDLGTFVKLPGLFQAFIACEPKHAIMKYCLDLCFASIVMRRTDTASVLSITGPVLAGVAFNLYFSKQNTYEKISPGNYSDNIRLLRMVSNTTVDEKGKKLFTNKFEGYSRGINDYGKTFSYYKDDPRMRHKKLFFYILIGIVAFGIFSFIFVYVYKRKFLKCKKECSV